jgi:hypothetical protein
MLELELAAWASERGIEKATVANLNEFLIRRFESSLGE